MYYLGSRYYSAEVGRFLNADGYVSTGFGLLGHNMYAYCNSNPVNMIDIGGSMPAGIADAYLPKMTIPMPDTEDIIKDLPGPAKDLTVNAVKKWLPNEPRPNNIGAGTWMKQIDNQIETIETFSKNADIVIDKLDYVEVFAETSGNIYKNSVSGKSLPKIAWDATVDTAILGVNVYTAGKAGAAVGSLFGPGWGTVIGAVVGGVSGAILSYVSDEPRRYIKTWVK